MPATSGSDNSPRLEISDTALLFEPHGHRPLHDADESLQRSLFTCRIPSSPLADYVSMLWCYRCEASVRVRERVLPTGTMGLVVDLRDGTPGPLVYGAHSQSYAVEPAGAAWSVGVNFKPGGAFPFLNFPAGELHNAHVALETFWGSQADALRARLLKVKGQAAMLRELEQTLLAQALRPLARHPVVTLALAEFRTRPHTQMVRDVTERIGLSQRRFIQLFTEHVGLTPKLFCRVRRFQDVLRLLRTEKHLAWADVAVNCGYYDQAHFINDFRAFSGLTPSVYIQVWGEHLHYGARWTR